MKPQKVSDSTTNNYHPKKRPKAKVERSPKHATHPDTLGSNPGINAYIQNTNIPWTQHTQNKQ